MSFKLGTAGMLALASLTLSGQEVNGFNWNIGWCDPFGPKVVQDFDIERYMGNWYNLAKDKDFSGGVDAPCSTATYTLRKD